ncbi:hypothetical protein [Xanthobacter autotrophicus]|uniref:hypothetical protein n=1 Tax=Xanthobacter autotrophicus TaxID=280 RepID=UPI0024A7526F|nr:hypothetical protein [Xanthobacter autotrophicus]MDI4655373.1 hypothetical protein [Xanthobacter autotrophicus]
MNDATVKTPVDTRGTEVEKAKDEPGKTSQWRSLMQATSSPIKLFALIVLVCNTVFGAAAAITSPANFMYTLHAFLAVVASFVLMAIWSPRSFYSPAELKTLLEVEQQVGRPVFPESKPWMMTLSFFVGLLVYAIYQFATR